MGLCRLRHQLDNMVIGAGARVERVNLVLGEITDTQLFIALDKARLGRVEQ